MNCTDCKYCKKETISYFTNDSIEIELGTFIIKCLKQIEKIDEDKDELHKNSTSVKFKGNRGIIGIIREYDCIESYKKYVKYNMDEIKTPEWCLLNKKK